MNNDGRVVQEVGDSCSETMLPCPIHVKETVSLSRTLRSFGDVVRNRRVDVLVNSSVLHGCWERQYASSHFMLEALKDLFWMTVDLNVAISLQHVKSADNPADAPSPRLSVVDSALAPRIWSTFQRVFGGRGVTHMTSWLWILMPNGTTMASHAPSHGCRFVHSRHHSGERFSVL